MQLIDAAQMLTEDDRFKDTTSERSMPRTPSQSNHMDGTVMMKGCSIMVSQRMGRRQRMHTGRVSSRLRTRSFRLDFSGAVNSLRSPRKGLTIHGSMERISTGCITICWASCRTARTRARTISTSPKPGRGPPAATPSPSSCSARTTPVS